MTTIQARPDVISLDLVRETLDRRELLPPSVNGHRQFTAHCPAHSDGTPSLSVGEGSDGRALITCHAGCTYPEIIQALDLWTDKDHRDTCSPRIYLSEPRISLNPWQERARALGITAPPGEPFACVLPGHDHEAKIERARRGAWRYYCGAGSQTLQEVFLCQRTGIDGVLLGHDALACRWFERLDHAAGLLEPTPVELSLPDECGDTVRKVAEHIALFLGLRAASGGYPIDAPFTFARSFVIDYCGVNGKQAQMAMDTLRDLGVIERVDTVAVHGGRRAILWRLG